MFIPEIIILENGSRKILNICNIVSSIYYTWIIFSQIINVVDRILITNIFKSVFRITPISSKPIIINVIALRLLVPIQR